MARIFITGSADGLGQLAAKALIAQGHSVVLHARSEKRGEQALAQAPGAQTAVTADLSSIDETKQLASKVNAMGRFDAIIHNAAVYNAPGEQIFKVNTLAPYILTCLIDRPGRLIYMSSDMHKGGRAKLESFKTGGSNINYSDSKLHMVMLCKAVARHWPNVYANAVNPGWVPTKMGGPGAPDSFERGYKTQAWLAVSHDEKAKVSGCYFDNMHKAKYLPAADNIEDQEHFLTLCNEITGVSF